MALLSKKKEKWVLQRRRALKGVLIGKETTKNAHADYYYRTALDKEFKRFIKSILTDLQKNYGVLKVYNAKETKPSPSAILKVLKLYRGTKLAIFLRNTEKIISKWYRLTSSTAKKSIEKVLSDMTGKAVIDTIPTASKDMLLKLAIKENVELIKNVSSQCLTNIESIVYDGMTSGEGWADIQKGLYHQDEIASRRVKLIARDQTAKATEAIEELTQRENGIKYFMWRTMEDERVRSSHRLLDGKIYKWGDEQNRLPVISTERGREIHGYPKQAIQCRCVPLPLIFLEGYQPKWDSRSRSYIVEKGKEKYVI